MVVAQAFFIAPHLFGDFFRCAVERAVRVAGFAVGRDQYVLADPDMDMNVGDAVAVAFLGEGDGRKGRVVEIFAVNVFQLFSDMGAQRIADIHLFALNGQLHGCFPLLISLST